MNDYSAGTTESQQQIITFFTTNRLDKIKSQVLRSKFESIPLHSRSKKNE
jgi:hypothetical protein